MLAAMLLAASATSVPIHVGRFDPADFPGAQKVERRMPQAELHHRVETILESGECRIPGQNKRQFDIVVPYAMLLEPNGAVTKVVVKDIGCARIERLVGEIALELSKAGDFRVQHQTGQRWYVSEVGFARMSETAARRQVDQNKVICRAGAPITGSRTRMAKVCMTVAEWNLFTTDRDTLRRDFQNQSDPRTSK